MITVIRSYFKRGSQVVLWIIVVAFVIGLMPSALRQAAKVGRWALKVNGQEIDYQTFTLETSKQRERIMAFRAQYGEYADWLLQSMDALNPQSVALRTLARQELINQFADKAGVYVGSDYIAMRMSDPAFVQETLGLPAQLFDPMGNLNQGMLTKYLKNYGLTVEMFERQIERALTEKLIMDVVMSSLYVPSFDSNQQLASEFTKKNFTVLRIPLEPFLAAENKVKLSDEQIKNFYDEQNQQTKRYMVPQKRSGKVWTFDPKTYNIAVGNELIEEYYERNKVKLFIDQPATVQVRRILFKVVNPVQRASVQEKAARVKDEILNKPGSFAQVAKSVSDDQESAKNGGLMPPFIRGKQEAIVDRAAFLLAEDGAISDVLETSNGYEILQRVSKKVQTFKPLATVRDDIKKTIIQKKFDESFAQDMKRILEIGDSKLADEALTALIKEKGGKAQAITNGILDGSPISQKLFSMKAGELAFLVHDEKGMAVKLTDVYEAYVPTLESIKNTVVQDLREHNALERLQAAVVSAKEELSATSFDALKKKYTGELTKTGWLENGKPESLKALEKKGVPVNAMLQLEKVGSVIVHMADDAGLLIRYDESAPLSGEDSEKKKIEMGQQFQEERMRQYQEGFIASLYRNATIETNESLVTLQE